MPRNYSISIADNTLSLRSSSTASMLPKPTTKRAVTRSTTGWDTPRMSPQQRIIMQRFDKQARHQKLMKRLFSYGFLK